MSRPLSVSFDLYNLHHWFGDDYRAMVDVASLADSLGVDEISITDHVVMGEATEQYPYGTFGPAQDYPWFEPMVTLGAVAAATQQIRLTSNVLIAPLRPAVLLAKQLATLDVLSRGRVAVGVGVGWQKAEYDASGVPWEHRYARLEEQLRVCKVLWREAPASYSGKTVSFDRLHVYPRPFSRDSIPFWFGVAPSERNCARIAELGDGWVPIVQKPEEIAAGVKSIRAAFEARGRDPETLGVRVMPRIVMGSNGRPDLGATLAAIPELHEAGATTVILMPALFCGPAEAGDFFRELVSARDKYLARLSS